MEQNVKRIDMPTPNEDKKCWHEIGHDPIKLGYLKEISRLWNESLGVDVRQQSNNRGELVKQSLPFDMRRSHDHG